MVKSQNGEIMNQASEIRNLKRQMGELAASSAIRQPGQLPSNTEVNPREHVNAITTRSGVQLSEVTVEDYEKHRNQRKNVVEEQNNEKEHGSTSETQEKTEEEVRVRPPVKAYVPPVPYPQRLRK